MNALKYNSIGSYIIHLYQAQVGEAVKAREDRDIGIWTVNGGTDTWQP